MEQIKKEKSKWISILIYTAVGLVLILIGLMLTGCNAPNYQCRENTWIATCQKVCSRISTRTINVYQGGKMMCLCLTRDGVVKTKKEVWINWNCKRKVEATGGSGSKQYLFHWE